MTQSREIPSLERRSTWSSGRADVELLFHFPKPRPTPQFLHSWKATESPIASLAETATEFPIASFRETAAESLLRSVAESPTESLPRSPVTSQARSPSRSAAVPRETPTNSSQNAEADARAGPNLLAGGWLGTVGLASIVRGVIAAWSIGALLVLLLLTPSGSDGMPDMPEDSDERETTRPSHSL